MVLYTCDGVKFHNITDEILVGGQCFTRPPSPWATCFRGNGFAAWAVGGKVSSKLQGMFLINMLFIRRDED